MRLITFRHSAANQQSWKCDRDSRIVQVTATCGCVISYDPDLSYSEFISPTSDGVTEEFALTTDNYPPLDFPLLKNQMVFVVTSSVGNVQLMIEDMLS